MNLGFDLHSFLLLLRCLNKRPKTDNFCPQTNSFQHNKYFTISLIILVFREVMVMVCFMLNSKPDCIISKILTFCDPD